MKLNLLPQTVSKGRALRTGWIFFGFWMILTIFACAAMQFAPQADYQTQVTRMNNAAQGAADAVATASNADTVIATAADVIRDASLGKAMLDHNDVYPDLYRDVKRYIPSFFRITSLSAQPIDGTSSQVTMVGVLDTYQQYADLMLAMMRWKDAKSISRTGFNWDEPLQPPVTQTDTNPMLRRNSEPTVPSDQLQRLAYYEGQNLTPPGYLALNGYGAGGGASIGAMPKASTVTVVMTVSKDLQVPDIAATLSGGGGAETGAGGIPAGFGGGMGPGGPMGGPGGPMGAGSPIGPGAAPGAGGAGPSTLNRKSQGAGGD